LSTIARHPTAPEALRAAVSVLVDRCRQCVAQALEGITPAAPAFALCLFPNQKAYPLAPDNIALGLETDRERERAHRSPFNAFVEVWNPTNYEYISLDEFDDPYGEPEWDAASASVIEWAREARVGDPASWLLEEAAAVLTRTPPLQPVTDDFVCWVFAEGTDLVESLKWIAPDDVQRKLAAKQFLPDEPRDLEGYVHYDWSDQPSSGAS
jgi:hypothetical protein